MSFHPRMHHVGWLVSGLAAFGMLTACSGGGSVGPQTGGNSADLLSVQPTAAPIKQPVCPGCLHHVLPL